MAEPTTPEKDEMISLPGSGGSDRKRRDDTIVMLPKAEKKQDDGGVVALPPKPGGKEIDLTGSASVTSSVPAPPKNSTFGLKGIAIEKTGPKDDAVTYSTSLKSVQRPKDGSLSADASTLERGMQRPKEGGVFTGGDHVTLGQGGMQRPKDSLFEEAGLHMREGAPLPKDGSLGQIGRGGLARPGPHPKEVDPSRGKLEVIDAAARQKNRDEEKRSDDDTDGGITWL